MTGSRTEACLGGKWKLVLNGIRNSGSDQSDVVTRVIQLEIKDGAQDGGDQSLSRPGVLGYDIAEALVSEELMATASLRHAIRVEKKGLPGN